jgi:hypothetical protein
LEEYANADAIEGKASDHRVIYALALVKADCGFRRSRPRIPIGSRPPIPI